MRWQDDVESDLKNMKMKGWNEKMRDGEQWRLVAVKVKAHPGLVWKGKENACYHSVQNLLSSRLLQKNVEVRLYKTIVLPVILYGCETWSLSLREGQR
jgi:hypothetical protein